MIFYDTETCGLHGMCVLIQYAVDDGPVRLHSVWTEPVIDTLKLIEWMVAQDMCGFNLAFDHFHLCKLYTVFSLVKDNNALPEDIIDEIAKLEPLGRDGQCIKPKSACDIILHARKGKYQSTMDRRDIAVRRIPTSICDTVRSTLEESIKLDDIYFSRRKDKLAPRWSIVDIDDCDDFKDIVLKFKASSALKNLVIHALGKTPMEVLKYGDISMSAKAYPVEAGYAPFALALSSPEKHWVAKVKKGSGWQRGFAWPALIRQHISHWTYNKLARKYAEDDVLYTRLLWKHLGSPKPGDDDSELACMSAANRWRGYKVDIEGVKGLREQAMVVAESAPTAPIPSREYLLQVMDEIETVVVNKSTKKILLEEVAMWEDDFGGKHPAALRAEEILNARMAKWEVGLYDKLIMAGRFHASFKIIGALSGRMSGADGLNAQGIKRAVEIRSKFILKNRDYVLCGGDFDAFEVVLAIAYYGDEKLAEEVQSGKKIHALFGTKVFPDLTYEQLLEDKEKYTRSKSGFFALIYFGNEHTLKTRLGVPIEVAQKAYQDFIEAYPGIGKGRQKIVEKFQSMCQPNGIGTRVEWHTPDDYIESMFGFRRYFTLENKICEALFKLANSLPKHLKGHKGKVVRRDREQTVSGATQSALYAAAFGIQASVTRAAGNHVIQSSGAQITKKVQRAVWGIQPPGIGMWLVQPMNIHDELMCPTHPTVVDKVDTVVNSTIESFRAEVPLIKMKWDTNLNSWADK